MKVRIVSGFRFAVEGVRVIDVKAGEIVTGRCAEVAIAEGWGVPAFAEGGLLPPMAGVTLGSGDPPEHIVPLPLGKTTINTDPAPAVEKIKNHPSSRKRRR